MSGIAQEALRLASENFGLTEIEPLTARPEAAVFRAQAAQGRVIVKLSRSPGGYRTGAELMAAFAGRSALVPRLIGHAETDGTSVQIVSELPGQPLAGRLSGLVERDRLLLLDAAGRALAAIQGILTDAELTSMKFWRRTPLTAGGTYP